MRPSCEFYLGRFRVASLLLLGISLAPLQAKTWTDRTGTYKVEAEYVGVEGTSVVLRKADGSTIKVPIGQLSTPSRERARELYEAARQGAPVPPPAATPHPINGDATTPESPVINPLAAGPLAATNSPIGFNPPVAPPVPPMPAFPEDATLQQAVDFVRDQALAGHPEVLWHALPDRLREVVDSSEYRAGILLLNEQSTTNQSLMTMLMKVVEVLVTKKDFVMNSNLVTAQIPADAMPLFQQAYDPAVGLAYEFAMLSLDLERLNSITMSQWLDDRGARLGGHLQSLVKVLPPGLIESYLGQVQVQQSSPTEGTITFPDPNGGGLQTVEMRKVDRRWLPASLAAKWEESAENFQEVMRAELEKMKQSQAELAAETQQADAMMATAATMAGGLLEPMLKANTQEEFDQSLMQLEAMARMLTPGMGAAGPPGAGPAGDGLPSGPGAFGPPGAFGEPQPTP